MCLPAPLFLFALPALEGLVDEDDVLSEPLDAVPGNVIILAPAEQTEEPAAHPRLGDLLSGDGPGPGGGGSVHPAVPAGAHHSPALPDLRRVRPGLEGAPGDQAVLTAALEENGIGHGPCCVLEMF